LVGFEIVLFGSIVFGPPGEHGGVGVLFIFGPNWFEPVLTG